MYQNQEKISYRKLLAGFAETGFKADCTGLTDPAKAFLIARLYREQRRPMAVVVSTDKDGERLLGDLRFFLPEAADAISYFPAYNLLPFKFVAYHNETAARRIRTLYRLIENHRTPLVVTTVEALLQRMIPKREIAEYAELVIAGEEIDREALAKKLLSGGYSTSTLVEEPGDLSIRGGVLDLFSPLYPEPMRLEFFGDMVESIRFFSPSSQRKTGEIPEAVILPACEAIVHSEDLVDIIHRVRARAAELKVPVTRTRELVDRLQQEEVFPGIESLIPFIYPDLDTLWDYLPETTIYIQDEPGALQKAADQFEARTLETYTSACEASALCARPDDLHLNWQQALGRMAPKAELRLRSLATISPDSETGPGVPWCQLNVQDTFDLRQALKTAGKSQTPLAPLGQWIRTHRENQTDVFLVCQDSGRAQRLARMMAPYESVARHLEAFPPNSGASGLVATCNGQISEGFVLAEQSVAVIPDREIFASAARKPEPSRLKAREQFLAFEQLKKDDLVVHVDYGIGQYDSLVKLTADGSTNDFLLIRYKDGDKLYLPVDRMGMIEKYMGVEGVSPQLDKMGGKSWARVKARVKRSAEKIAGELLKLYATRKIEGGHVFKTVDSDYDDFESGFDYEETTDQLKAIEDVLQDMAQPTPMDRLICGDVGYGKTEVALRAAFVAALNGKQVAVLVPTTVLAEQHCETFRQRFERFPIEIACLSRFRPAAVQRNIVRKLKDGKIDIVVGTHRLLQKDIVFNDLGLLVLDEEQRFGVKHKEKLKRLKKSVDVLAMTATPIPRTLHLSLTGIRDISVISTPPEYRRPIVTYVCEYEDLIVKEAVEKELDRCGQIFFVHNAIHSIERIAGRLKDLVPRARIAVAHGRMDDGELEEIMFRFMQGEIDLLVCTTIIESGLDVPAANTIMINRADRFGLAQIYQLRGRVGRANEQAYAYLFVPKESSLTKDARKRLKVLMEHSDLGSGFQIAMNDLKIRGGGTILGASQSGHIAAVGYDMFLQLMETAVSELKGQQPQVPLEPEINLPFSAFLPENYIADIDQRLSLYRRLARMRDPAEIGDMKNELMDRFGSPPPEAMNLLLKILLRILSVQAGVKQLDLAGDKLILQFSEAHQKNPAELVEWILGQPKRCRLNPDHSLAVDLSRERSGHLTQAKNILKEIKQRVNA